MMNEGYKQPAKTITKGSELVERREGGFEKYLLEPGSYQIDFGFRLTV